MQISKFTNLKKIGLEWETKTDKFFYINMGIEVIIIMNVVDDSKQTDKGFVQVYYWHMMHILVFTLNKTKHDEIIRFRPLNEKTYFEVYLTYCKIVNYALTTCILYSCDVFYVIYNKAVKFVLNTTLFRYCVGIIY